jgi:methyl-accepting chemotaxis protein
MTLDFILAKKNHLIWEIKLGAYIKDIEIINEDEIICHDCCILGKWLYGYGLEKYKDLPDIKKLEEKHIKLHKVAKKIIILKKKGLIEEAFAELDKIKIISEKIIDLLDKLEKIIAKFEGESTTFNR